MGIALITEIGSGGSGGGAGGGAFDDQVGKTCKGLSVLLTMLSMFFLSVLI